MSDDQEKKSSALKWIGCGCGGCLLGFLGFIALIAGTVGFAFWGIRGSDVYTEAVARARENQQVVAAIGEPIEAGLLVSGSFNISGSNGSADVAIPISGPKGEAVLSVEARKRSGTWEYELMEVEIKGTGERIDLLTEEYSL